MTHGFLSPTGATPERKSDKLECIVDFVRDSINSYARSALPFVSDAHILVHENVVAATDSIGIAESLSDLHMLDDLYETMTLNHVSRRASKTQGVALLSLYSKGFTKPPVLRGHDDATNDGTNDKDSRIRTFIDKLKLAVRREETHGHLPICWGVLTAALGLSLGADILSFKQSHLSLPVLFTFNITDFVHLERSQFLHLFLYARGLLSAGVRMNIIGPYGAQQLLLYAIRPIVTAESKACGTLRTGLKHSRDRFDASVPSIDENALTFNGPATTWPLGEILAARHDLQHSRIFNS